MGGAAGWRSGSTGTEERVRGWVSGVLMAARFHDVRLRASDFPVSRAGLPGRGLEAAPSRTRRGWAQRCVAPLTDACGASDAPNCSVGPDCAGPLAAASGRITGARITSRPIMLALTSLRVCAAPSTTRTLCTMSPRTTIGEPGRNEAATFFASAPNTEARYQLVLKRPGLRSVVRRSRARSSCGECRPLRPLRGCGSRELRGAGTYSTSGPSPSWRARPR